MDIVVTLLLIPSVALGLGLLVLAKSPRSLGVRLTVALVLAAIGFAPLVFLLIGLSGWPTGE